MIRLLLIVLVGLFSFYDSSAQSQMATWTFETSIPSGTAASSSDYAAEGGLVAGAQAKSVHAVSSTYSSPAGNGSAHSFSSNAWAIGDYYQFSLNSTGYKDIHIGWDQTGSNTGPKDFKLQYSTDGSTFTDFYTYAVINNSWSATTSKTGSSYSVDLSSVTALNNSSTLVFRLVMTTANAISGTFGSGGTSRIDNVAVTGTDTTPPTFTSSYPQSANIASANFDVVVNLNEAGKAYYVVLADGATPPSADQVKAGQDDQGASVTNSGSISVTASGTDYSKTVSGLSSNTNYDVYVVAEDAVPNLQASPVLINVMTNVSPSITTISGYSFPGVTSKSKQSASVSYTVSAANLTADVSVSVSGNFLISSDNNTFSNSLTISAADLSSPQTVYVKFNPSGNVGTLTGTITHSSAGASDKTISLSAVSIDPFSQDFNDPAFLTNSGWIQYSVTGAQIWASTNFGHTCLTGCTNATADKAAQINGFSGSAQNNEDWLISPQLDLTTFTNYPALSFATISAFAGDQLQLKYSTDYSGSGSPALATWTAIDGKFPASNSSLWTTSSNIILPKSNLYVAFIYTSNTTAASRWTLDDWKVEDISNFINVPSINFSFGEVLTANTSSSQNFNFTAQGYGDITVSAPTGFEVSLDNSTFSSSVLVTASNASAGQIIYARFAPSSKQIKWTGAISFAGTGLSLSSGSLSGSSYPKSETFNVATYNMEFFGTDVKDATNVEFGPTDDALQVANVTTVMQTIAADVFAVEEISDDNALSQLVSNLTGYSKVVADRWSYSWQAPDPNFPPQKTGFIYNTSKMQLVSSRVMFASMYDSIVAGTKTLPSYPTGTSSSFWSSGRLPFMATFDVTVNGVKRRIRLIDIHGKSEGSGAWDRRVYDNKVLHDSLAAHYPHDNIILLGDFNDQVYNSITSGKASSYSAFVTDANNFKAITYDLNVAGATTYPSIGGFIDNIIISNELVNALVANSVSVEDPRNYISNYISTTSDHLPVWSRFLLSSKADQTLAFNALPAKTYGDANFALTAATSSGLTATFTSSDPSIVSINGNVATILKGGSVTITASQSGNADFNAAASVDQPLTINKANQTVTFNALTNKKFGDADFTLSGTASSGLAVTYQSSDASIVSINGNTLSIHKAGSVNIIASQAGNTNYSAATNVTQPLTIGKADQTITFNALGPVTQDAAPFALTASTNSNLTITYGSDNLAVATIQGSTVTITGLGSANITASQAGNENYNAATSVIRQLVVTTVTGVEPSMSSMVRMYPNPTNGVVTIEVPGKGTEVVEVKIVNAIGSLVMEREMQSVDGKVTVDLNGLQPGMYLVNVATSAVQSTQRIIKK